MELQLTSISRHWQLPASNYTSFHQINWSQIRACTARQACLGRGVGVWQGCCRGQRGLCEASCCRLLCDSASLCVRMERGGWNGEDGTGRMEREHEPCRRGNVTRRVSLQRNLQIQDTEQQRKEMTPTGVSSISCNSGTRRDRAVQQRSASATRRKEGD